MTNKQIECLTYRLGTFGVIVKNRNLNCKFSELEEKLLKKIVMEMEVMENDPDEQDEHIFFEYMINKFIYDELIAWQKEDQLINYLGNKLDKGKVN